jgi:short subunit dehydrogenase-like uncharacterized protein
VTVAIYGATGRLGQLVAERVDATLGLVLVARRRESLDRLPQTLRDHRTEVAPGEDRDALLRAFSGSRVVVNCAPAGAVGDRIARAAIDTGAHYIDAAGDQSMLRRMFGAFSDETARRRLAIVLAFGFDYAIGDCLSRLAAAGREPLDSLVVAYFVEGPDVTGHSATAAASGKSEEVVYRERQWRAVPFELDRASFDFPPPVGTRQMSRYGSGEVVTVPRHTSTREIRTLITSTSLCPHPALLPIFPLLRPLIAVVRRSPARGLLRAGARLATRSAPGPATPLDRGASTRRFMVAVDAVAVDRSICRAVAEGGNFHTVTALLLARGAEWLANGDVVGVHSAATAFAPAMVLDALRPEGVTWSVGVLARPTT